MHPRIHDVCLREGLCLYIRLCGCTFASFVICGRTLRAVGMRFPLRSVQAVVTGRVVEYGHMCLQLQSGYEAAVALCVCSFTSVIMRDWLSF